mgnify:CR=1 FL=1
MQKFTKRDLVRKCKLFISELRFRFLEEKALAHDDGIKIEIRRALREAGIGDSSFTSQIIPETPGLKLKWEVKPYLPGCEEDTTIDLRVDVPENGQFATRVAGLLITKEVL